MALCITWELAMRFGQALAKPEFRELLQTDPVRALKSEKIRRDAIPADHLKVFSEMSTEELELLGNIALKLGSIQ